MEDQLHRPEAVAKRFDIDRRTVYRMMSRGELKSVVISKGARRIPESEVQRYLRERLETSPKPEAY